MRKRRERVRVVYDEDEPPAKEKKPPPKDRKARWAASAQEMKTLAKNMLMDETRVMMERLAQGYERMAERAE